MFVALLLLSAAAADLESSYSEGQAAAARGDYKSAASHYRDALRAHTNSSGDDAGRAALLSNLGVAQVHLKRHKEAEALFRQAIEIQQSAMGSGYARDLSNLAVLYSTLGRFSEAEPLYLRSLAVLDAEPERHHDARALSLESLAELCRRTTRPADAEAFFRRAADSWARALGPLDPQLAVKLETYARLLRKTEYFATAAEFDARAMRIRVKSAAQSDRRSE